MQRERQAGGGPYGTERYPKGCRLLSRKDFRRVQSNGRPVHTRNLLLLVTKAGQAPGRLGITVTKKVAPAVGRNRIKRLVREVYRRNRDYFPDTADIVVIAKRGAPRLDYERAHHELHKVRGALHTVARDLTEKPA